MAASFNLTRPDLFPEGTSVGAYPVTNWPNRIPDTSVAPPGSATESKTVTSGVAAFVALTAGVRYLAYASVGGQHRYVRFLPGTVAELDIHSPVKQGQVGAASGIASLDANSKVVQSRADQAILARELSDLAGGPGWLPSGAIAETFPRHLMMASIGLVSGRIQLSGGIVIPGGRQVTSVSVAGNGAATTPTNQWFCLVDRSGNVLVKTVDDTTTAWAATTVKTLNLSPAYTPTNAIEVYVGVVVVAATPTSLWRPGGASGAAYGAGGGFGDSANNGLTNPASLGATISPVPSGQTAFYAYVS